VRALPEPEQPVVPMPVRFAPPSAPAFSYPPPGYR
jgi:hypothetical protein